MFVQSLTISKVLIEASFEGVDKSVLKYKNMKDYSSSWRRSHITMSYTIRLHHRFPNITALATITEIIFFPDGDSERRKWNKITFHIDLRRKNTSIYFPQGTWGSLNSHSFKASGIKLGRVWITFFFVFLPYSVLATLIISEIYQK